MAMNNADLKKLIAELEAEKNEPKPTYQAPQQHTTQPILIYMVIGLVIVSIFMGLIILTSQGNAPSSAAHGVNKNISEIRPEVTTAINTTLTPLAQNFSNTIKSIPLIVTNATANVVIAENNNTKGLTGVNRNLTSLGSGLSTLSSTSSTQYSTSQATLSAILTKLNSTSNTIQKLNTTLLQSTGLGWLKVPEQKSNRSTNNYTIEPMLSGFSNHINYTASNSFNISVLTYSQFLNFTNGRSYGITSFYQSSGSQNTINFYFNQSFNCDRYFYIADIFPQDAFPRSSTNNVILYPNITVKYQPSATQTGVC